jgi:hypothetical protein
MIINITHETFGGAVRNGDLIAVCNVVEYLRKQIKPEVKLHMLPGSINQADYCQKFYDFLLKQTNYFSEIKGTETLGWKKVNLWDFREISGDLVVIPNELPMSKKIVIFPVFDAPYNVYRNWPQPLFVDILNKYDTEEYKDYEKIICSKEVPSGVGLGGYEHSQDFMQNIYHIMTAEIFVGGDTGTTHFAFALDRGPKSLKYYNSGRGLVHTLPFYLMKGKGENNGYWLNFENTNWG